MEFSSDSDDIIYTGDWIAVRAMTRTNGQMPAKTWVHGLNKKGYGQFLAALRILETTLRSGRPPAGRAELVKTSKHRLMELKVTKPGSTPPHLRLMYLQKGPVLWAAIGFTKKSNGLSKREVAAADEMTREWLGVEEKK